MTYYSYYWSKIRKNGKLFHILYDFRDNEIACVNSNLKTKRAEGVFSDSGFYVFFKCNKISDVKQKIEACFRQYNDDYAFCYNKEKDAQCQLLNTKLDYNGCYFIQYNAFFCKLKNLFCVCLNKFFKDILKLWV